MQLKSKGSESFDLTDQTSAIAQRLNQTTLPRLISLTPLILLFIALVYMPSSFANETDKTASDKTINIYTTNWCPACNNAKTFFHNNKIPYIEHNVEEDPEARKRFDELGAVGVPYIVIGNGSVTGFYATQICDLLGIPYPEGVN